MAKKIYKLNNPKAPASKGQLYYLHLLTGKDTRKSKLTMKQAQEQITKFKANPPKDSIIGRKATKTILEPSNTGKRGATIKHARSKGTTSSDKLESLTTVRGTEVKSKAAIKALNKS